MGQEALPNRAPVDRNAEHDARVRAALAARGVSWQCTSCGSDEVDLDEASGLTPGLPYFRHFEFASSERGVLDIYVLRCRNCGFIRLFDRNIVDGNAP
jgi:predicted nucleic-acid-binding Zn-ribbon protein